jgi:uncharacterized membrane protein
MSGREENLDGLVAWVLLIGVLISAALLVAGSCWNWALTGKLVPNYHLGGMNLLKFLALDLAGVIHGRVSPRLLINAGIAALMITPWVRVLISMLFFAFAQKNWMYTAFTAFVLAVLTWSLTLR